MAPVANPWAVPGLVMGLAAYAMAAVVYFTRPSRRQNVLLALVLFLEGTVAFTGTGLMFATDAYASAYAWQGVTVLALLALPPAYLLFIGTLDSPVRKVLGGRAAAWTLGTMALVAPVAWFVGRDAFVLALAPVPFAPWEIVPGPAFFAVVVAVASAYLVGLVAALFALRRSAPGMDRTRARAFLLAFVFHDVTFSLVAFGPTFIPGISPSTPLGVYVFAMGPAFTQVLYLPLLAYGILKAQLFDIDLKLKATVRRSTVVAVFAAVFFGVAEVAQSFLNDAYGYVAGGLAAAVLLFALRPVEAAAGRVADAAMPGVDGSAEYLAFRRFEVYRAALASAASDGTITERERAVLATLAEKLGIRGDDATRLERDVLAGG